MPPSGFRRALRPIATLAPIAGLALAALAGAAAAVAQEPARTVNPTPLEGKIMIVYDSSGSMAGEVRVRSGGERKFEVAQREFARLIDGLGAIKVPVDVGLMTYGHRRRGDCHDIEVLVAPARNHDPAHRDRLKAAVAGLKTRGMTPIAESIAVAAGALKYTEQRAIVVLISDGVEECGGDPCRMAAELERDGIDFTAHVVGFDLDQRELEALTCVARATSGEVLAAADAPDLAHVIDQLAARIVREEWQRQRGRAVFRIAMQGSDGEIVPPAGTEVIVIPAGGVAPAASLPFRGPEAMASLAPGHYRAALRGAVPSAAEAAFTVDPASDSRVTLSVRPSRLSLTTRIVRAAVFAEAAAAPVLLAVEHASPTGSARTVATAENALEKDLLPRPYRVIARYRGVARDATVDLQIEEREALEFVFGPGKVEAAVVNQNDRPVVDPQVTWRIEPLDPLVARLPPAEFAGASLAATLPPGRYRLTGRIGIETATEEIEIRPEEVAVIKLKVFEPM